LNKPETANLLCRLLNQVAELMGYVCYQVFTVSAEGIALQDSGSFIIRLSQPEELA
jgi:hypothetical protein